jgi:hypothetical protein
LLASGFELHEVETVSKALPSAEKIKTRGHWALLAVQKP